MNPNNPTRKDHPAHKLVDGLMTNPWDDFPPGGVHDSSAVVKVDPRTSMSMIPRTPDGKLILPNWAKLRELRQLALDEQTKGMDGIAKID